MRKMWLSVGHGIRKKTHNLSLVWTFDFEPTLQEGINMSEKETALVAIERNIRIQLTLHPNPRNFIKTLQNEAIDQAFREIHNEIKLIKIKIDFLEKRTHHLAPKTKRTDL